MNERYYVISLERSLKYISFWKVGDHGYTMEYTLAKIFSREEIDRRNIKIIDKIDIIKNVKKAFEVFEATEGRFNKIAIPVEALKDLAIGITCYAFRECDE